MSKSTRSIVLVALLLCAVSASVFARGTGFAIGGEGGLYLAGNGGLPTSAMITFHVPQVPLMFGVGVNQPFAIAATADYWAAHGNLPSVFAWYAGVGAYAAINTNGGSVTVGGRIPIGLQAWVLKQTLELFVEAAPAIGVSFVPTGFDWHLQAAVGLRFWP
ncbi:MAG TPA: hypothetical protein VFI08_08305 [Spirochaetia bacterium]|nr:hypothetical protein [Spirochaetia bacterium]